MTSNSSSINMSDMPNPSHDMSEVLQYIKGQTVDSAHLKELMSEFRYDAAEFSKLNCKGDMEALVNYVKGRIFKYDDLKDMIKRICRLPCRNNTQALLLSAAIMMYQDDDSKLIVHAIRDAMHEHAMGK